LTIESRSLENYIRAINQAVIQQYQGEPTQGTLPNIITLFDTSLQSLYVCAKLVADAQPYKFSHLISHTYNLSRHSIFQLFQIMSDEQNGSAAWPVADAALSKPSVDVLENLV
jgi:hypothetical protein